jgi:hypothetical protein
VNDASEANRALNYWLGIKSLPAGVTPKDYSDQREKHLTLFIGELRDNQIGNFII